VVKRRLLQFNQNVHVAFRTGIAPGERTENPDALHRETTEKFIANLSDCSNYLVSFVCLFFYRGFSPSMIIRRCAESKLSFGPINVFAGKTLHQIDLIAPHKFRKILLSPEALSMVAGIFTIFRNCPQASSLSPFCLKL